VLFASPTSPSLTQPQRFQMASQRSSEPELCLLSSSSSNETAPASTITAATSIRNLDTVPRQHSEKPQEHKEGKSFSLSETPRSRYQLLRFCQQRYNNCVTASLDIHPMFHRQNIRRCDFETHLYGIGKGQPYISHDLPISTENYKRLAPSLRLASKFLQESEPFHTKVLFATLHYDPVCEEIQYLDPDYAASDQERASYQ
jgi:hypothetical protein